MPEILFMVGNHHYDACGQLPGGVPVYEEKDDGIYRGYFENEHGEQWIFTYNRKDQQLVIRGGDLCWKPMTYEGITSLLLSEEEELWLKACIRAAGADEQ